MLRQRSQLLRVDPGSTKREYRSSKLWFFYRKNIKNGDWSNSCSQFDCRTLFVQARHANHLFTKPQWFDSRTKKFANLLTPRTSSRPRSGSLSILDTICEKIRQLRVIDRMSRLSKTEIPVSFCILQYYNYLCRFVGILILLFCLKQITITLRMVAI